VQKLWGVLFGIVMLAAALLFAVAPMVQGWWLPLNIASYGGQIDNLFYLILAITGFFFILTEAILVYAMIKYAGEPGRKAAYVHGHHNLEVVWTVIPGAILLFIALWQINVWAEVKYYKNMPRPDEKPLQVEVTARQWEWRLRYASPARMERIDGSPEEFRAFGATPHEDDVHVVNEIHTWQKNKVLVTLKTRDVLHSFFIPHARIKQDALPGKAIPVWFDAEKFNTVRQGDKWVDGINPDTGKSDPEYVWELACAEFCGTRHSLMRGKVYVHKDKADFLDWLKSAQNAQNYPNTSK
jgi:cytochrome c oxidase subunit II